MAKGALHFGAVASDRVGIGQPAALLNITTLTVLAVARFTGAIGGGGEALVSWPGNGTGTNGNVMLRLSGAGGNAEWRIAQATTTADFITNDTPFVTTAWRFIAATYDQGAATRGHIYSGLTPAGVAENSYGTANSGAGNKNPDSGTDPIVWGNRWIGTSYGGPWLGDIAVGAIFASVLSLADIQSWCATPRRTVGSNVAAEFGRGGKDGADWIDYAGNTGTVTGATQIDGTPLAAGGEWSRQGRLFLKAA